MAHLKPTADKFYFATKQNSLACLEPFEHEGLVEPKGSQELVSLSNQDIQNVFAVTRDRLVDIGNRAQHVGCLIGFQCFDLIQLSEVVVGARKKEQQIRSGAKPKFLKQRRAMRPDAAERLQRLSQRGFRNWIGRRRHLEGSVQGEVFSVQGSVQGKLKL